MSEPRSVPPVSPCCIHGSALPSLHRVPRGQVPRLRRYYGVLRFPDVLPAALRFLRTTVTTPRACFRSCQVRRRPGAGGFGSGTSPRGQFLKRWRRQGVPSSWGTLLCLRPALGPRRDQRYQAIAVGRHGPTRIQLRGLSTRGNFGARSHGIGTRCLRFAPWVTPKDARLASGCWPALPDGIGCPQGSYERFPRCSLHRFPLSQASWRKPGRPGGYPQGSHRSGLAQLRHPARQPAVRLCGAHPEAPPTHL